MANEMGLVGMFYVDRTVALSRHVLRSASATINTAMPVRKTQKYLCNVWSRVRAKWEGIIAFGFPCSRPHHDWNAALAPAGISRPEGVELAHDIFHEYALRWMGSEPAQLGIVFAKTN